MQKWSVYLYSALFNFRVAVVRVLRCFRCRPLKCADSALLGLDSIGYNSGRTLDLKR